MNQTDAAVSEKAAVIAAPYKKSDKWLSAVQRGTAVIILIIIMVTLTEQGTRGETCRSVF